MAKFFSIPFAATGDKTPIPNTVQPDGSISYPEGYGLDYEGNLLTDPSAKAVPRTGENEVLFDITSAIQVLQVHGVPDFITTSDNGGTAYPYDINSIVRYDDGVNGPRNYISLIDANVDLPSVESSWAVANDNSGQGGLNIINATFEGSVATGDVVAWNAISNYFQKAIATGGFLQNALGIADITAGTVTLAGLFSNSTGLTNGGVYYLSNMTSGQITTTVPSNNIVQIGNAISATEILININQIRAFQKAIYTTTGTFVVPRNVSQINISACGGGGGGGGSGGVHYSGFPESSGGGGGGGAAQTTYQTLAVVPGETLSIVIGAGGTGGTAGSGAGAGTDGGNGSPGGNTQILRVLTPLMTANGGSGGNFSPTSDSTLNGSNGGDSTFDGGSPGNLSIYLLYSGSFIANIILSGCGGNGGNSEFGSGGGGGPCQISTQTSGTVGFNGNGAGSGGGGAGGAITASSSQAGGVGGNGSGGIVIIEY